MFFVTSKILWLFVKPLNFLALLFILGLIFSFFAKRLGQGLLLLSITLFLILGLLPVGYNMMVYLERQYERPSALPPQIEGIIVLGGSLDSVLSRYHRYPVASGGVERLHDAAQLFTRYPMAEMVISGGSGYLGEPRAIEAPHAERFFMNMNVPGREWILYEQNSKNTFQNALYTQNFMMPNPGERWLLVTSAFHMPRSMAVFKQIDWDVIPYPTDHRTDLKYRLWTPMIDFQKNFDYLDIALREFVGTLAYGLSGKSALLWPAKLVPSDNQSAIGDSQ